jgi:hypothetical protein
MTDPDTWYFGNATTDGAAKRGWLVGHFVPPGDVRLSRDVEIKWGIHPAGEQREGWHDDERRTTAVVLVKGRFRIDLSLGTVLLANEGDYVVWGPGIGHTWRAEEYSVVITIRWPSLE